MTRFESDIFNFNNIPMTELDKAYIDYEPLCALPLFVAFHVSVAFPVSRRVLN